MKYLHLYMTAVLAIVLDQITKWTVLAKFQDFERVNIIPNFFDLTLVYNYGAAFSFLANHNGWQKYFFIVLAFVISGWLISEVRKGALGTLGNFAAAMVIGGAFGNVIDRLVHGKVVDFLLFYYQNWYYPAFNVADCFVCVGAALLVIDGFKNGNKNKG